MTAHAPAPAERPSPAPRLVVDGLAVDRGGRRVLDAIGFTLEAGSALIVTGPNGAGKSTLLRAVLGLVPRRAGSVTVENAKDGEADEIGRHCHYLGHGNAVKTALTVRENLAFWRVFLGGGGLSAETALDALDLAALADLPAAWLSAGQRRRLALARLLVARRPIWLLDEPTTALDAAAEARVRALAADHLAAGGSVIAATHLPFDLPHRRLLALAPLARRPTEADSW